ncbi:NUDIX hydrolase [Streptomyces sp. N35]|uniref:NUDIX hydrolase n=1 Tax=Streptomyces sp. N35 TaxID=2795730 RepID=UPI0018F47D0F|nr:NUDIX hydrolase [Streptomyces sp. N35]
MDVVDTWTGQLATALQDAFRDTNERFAERLGIGVRTVASWHNKPTTKPTSEIQAVLDTAYERAGEAVRTRFVSSARSNGGGMQAQALRVAIAIVVRGNEVLLVCRRGDERLRWQFPAGMVKPGAHPEDVAIQETAAETGVHAAVREQLGERLHPQTGVMACYFLADYLTGEAVNADAVENSAVLWVAIRDLPKFIPADKIYPPIMAALEAAA